MIDGPSRAPAEPPAAMKPNSLFPLFGPEQVGHEGPEYRDDEQVEDADPDKEYPCDVDGADLEGQQDPEDQDVGDKKTVDQRDKALAREARHGFSVERHRAQHGQEGRGEQPWQVPDAALDAHLVAQRPKYVIGGENTEEIGESEKERADLVRTDIDDLLQ